MREGMARASRMRRAVIGQVQLAFEVSLVVLRLLVPGLLLKVSTRECEPVVLNSLFLLLLVVDEIVGVGRVESSKALLLTKADESKKKLLGSVPVLIC